MHKISITLVSIIWHIYFFMFEKCKNIFDVLLILKYDGGKWF